jgi:plastocyanin
MRAILTLALVLAFTIPGCFGAKDAAVSPASAPGNVTATAAAMNTTAASASATAANASAAAAPVVELTFKLAGVYPANPTFDPPTAEVKAGSMVKVTFQDTDLNPLGAHNWVLDGVKGAATPVVAQGKSATITFLAPPPGTYAFYCGVPGHRGFGMEGKLTVK